jgi:hypothetical protein
MGRVIGGVIAGYVVMFIVVFVLLTGAYLGLGADRAFEEASFTPSMTWLGLMFVVGLVAAIIGGVVCAAIAPNTRAPVALVVVVLVLGAASAIPAFMPPDADQPTVRSGDLSNMDAMMSARTPAWVAIANPVIGAIGVMLGARLRRGKQG